MIVTSKLNFANWPLRVVHVTCILSIFVLLPACSGNRCGGSNCNPEFAGGPSSSLLGALFGPHHEPLHTVSNDPALKLVIEPLNLSPREEVERFVREFQGKRRVFLVKSLVRGREHFPIILQTLRAHSLPELLLSVPIVESGLKRSASSRRGAKGPWQFMPRTARRLGLRVNVFVDERSDFKKSTEAAAKYLTELYDRFGTWELALAAYNCGQGKVARAARIGGTNDFYVLADRRFFSKETRHFVPKVLAIARILNDPAAHGFLPTELAGLSSDLSSDAQG